MFLYVPTNKPETPSGKKLNWPALTYTNPYGSFKTSISKICDSEFHFKAFHIVQGVVFNYVRHISIYLKQLFRESINEHVLQTTGKLKVIWPNRNFLSTFLCVLQSLNWIKVNPPLDYKHFSFEIISLECKKETEKKAFYSNWVWLCQSPIGNLSHLSIIARAP